MALLVLAFALVPNNPHPAWYAIPEIACDLVTNDQDQWRCDMEPVVWQRHWVAANLQPSRTAR